MNKDPYVYPGTNVLRNARDIRDAGDLQIIEANLTYMRSLQLTGADGQRDAQRFVARKR